MQNISYKAKNKANVQKKPRIYFTCHPDDFDRYFDEICEDIFASFDPAIYYTEDMNETFSDDEERAVDLSRYNLFVVPITYKLLTTPSRAMDEDVAFAKENHKPILPIMMEEGLEKLYADRFGKAQFITPKSSDNTEIPYKEKLEKFLEGVLVNDELQTMIRNDFAAYIFLSYRKKDRKYANRLMRLIHKDEKFRDVAIWFDEFLTPGEEFDETIINALDKSRVFTLLVTPNLLEKPNFVMSEEYPRARESEKKILPAMMVKTNETDLRREYENLPDCVDPKTEGFYQSLSSLLGEIDRKTDADHDYLMGMAYLQGIDVEVDQEKGLELINKASERGCVEAHKRLYLMYLDGNGVPMDLTRALKFAQKYYEGAQRAYGANDKKTLTALSHLGTAYTCVGDYKKALELRKKLYSLECKVYGETHVNTLGALNNQASSLRAIGEQKKALELNQKSYTLHLKKLGEEHPNTMISRNNLIFAYIQNGDYKRALEHAEKAYEVCAKILGPDSSTTISALRALSTSHRHLGNHKKSLEFATMAYNTAKKKFGETDSNTTGAYSNLSYVYLSMGKYRKALSIQKKLYAIELNTLGEDHPSTNNSFSGIGAIYNKMKRFKKALPILEKAYEKEVSISGEEAPTTLTDAESLANAYRGVGKKEKALEIYHRCYNVNRRVKGEEHPDTLISLSNLALIHADLGNSEKARKLSEKALNLKTKNLGGNHPDTLHNQMNYALTLPLKERFELLSRTWKKQNEVLGKKHPDTLNTLANISHYIKKNVIFYLKFVSGLSLEVMEYEKKFGKDHPKTVAVTERFDVIYEALLAIIKSMGWLFINNNALFDGGRHIRPK